MYSSFTGTGPGTPQMLVTLQGQNSIYVLDPNPGFPSGKVLPSNLSPSTVPSELSLFLLVL